MAADPALASLAGLRNLSSVGGDLYIRGDTALTSLADLAALTSVAGHAYVDYDTRLPNCVATAFRDRLGLGGRACIRGNLADSCPDDTSGC